MHLDTKLCEILGITNPIIQAGMAGGPTTVELVASVSNSGGLGTLGAAYMKPEGIRAAIRKIKEQTSKPFAVNLFCTDWQDQYDGVEESQKVLNVIREKLGLEYLNKKVETNNFFEEQFEVLIQEKVPVISTAFGILPRDKMAKVKEQGIKVTSMVTTVREAQLAEKEGADIIIAQGSDAGGHRGTFEIEKNTLGATIGTFSLVPQVVDAVSVPVVAAGGIMDSRGLVAALALGAQGVQMGTAFLTTVESGAHPVYKEALVKSTEESTVITKVFSGRPARGIKNAFIQAYQDANVSPADFPTQNTLTSDIRKEAALQNNPEFMSLWAGQGTRLLQNEIPAEKLISDLVAGAKRILS
ncbi:nitronate monooxygenase [Bacillus sp. AFS076308]|uniref:NAD(P)H-dependent flavin oxidoreductase n=1 Tax=unclassified Bacillus (in: firmicutes) TaxID=185979 RepID=UPI000BF33E77|nr:MULTISPECIES: nitronate monooxygenase family protein [unclassified Bacillus (in: firmicutes)]PFN98114.1 nitronate monooxygenase [Bacillus sp. AFS076308]PGV50829.1 nitronate monooxygenase [Bacillus sp. AFS037270]